MTMLRDAFGVSRIDAQYTGPAHDAQANALSDDTLWLWPVA
jgi:hypothetical protein